MTYSASDDDYTLTVNITSNTANAANNSSTLIFNMTLKANTNWYANSTQTFGYLKVDGVDIIADNWAAAVGTTNRGFTGTGQTITVAASTSKTYTHNTNGSRSVRFQAGWKTGPGSDDWRITPGITIDNTLTLTDFTRTPTTPVAPTLTRSTDRTSLTITGATATFYGTTASYEYQISTNSGTTWTSGASGALPGTVATLGTNRISTLTVANTATIIARTRAKDSEGTGAWSPSSTASAGAPGTPTINVSRSGLVSFLVL